MEKSQDKMKQIVNLKRFFSSDIELLNIYYRRKGVTKIKELRQSFVLFIILYFIIAIGFIFLIFDHIYDGKTALNSHDRKILNEIGQLNLVGDEAFPPLSFKDGQGQYSGYEADLIKVIEAKLEIPIQYRQVKWSEAIEDLKAGTVHGVTGMRVPDTRMKGVYFTQPFWQTAFASVSRNQAVLEVIMQKPTLKVAVQKGSSTLAYFKEHYHKEGIEYLLIDQPEEGIQALMGDRVDIWVESHLVARHTALREDLIGNLHFNPLGDHMGHYAMAVGDDYANLIPILNKVLHTLEKDGVLASLDKKWFGLANVRGKDIHWPLIIFGIIFFVVTLVMISFFWNSVLQYKVDEKRIQHRLLLNNIPSQVWYLKNESTYGLVNRAHAEFLGKEPEELEGKKLEDIYFADAERLKRIIQLHRQVITTKKTLCTEERVKNYRGELRILKITRTPKLDEYGDVEYIVCSAEDITDNKLAQEILQAREEKYRTTFENTGTAMLIIEEDTTISLVNHETTNLAGFERQELIGNSWVKLVPSHEVERMMLYHKARRKPGANPPRQYEFQIKHKDGHLVDVYITANTIPYTKQTVASIIDASQIKAMEHDLRRRKNKIEKLHDIAIKMERCHDEEMVYQLIIEAAEGILNFSICSVDMVEGDYMVVKATSSGLPPAGVQNFPVSQGIAGMTYRTGKTYLVGDVCEVSEARPASSEYRSAISAPIGNIGVFQVISHEIHAFNQEDVELSELLLSHAAEAINRIRSEEQIRYMSYHDSLTGLYNRAFFDQELNRLNQAKELPMTLITGDINGLKLVNDVFGHDKGDELIIQIAQILKQSCRKIDLCFRWGGDEFAILLPRTNEQEALVVFERIKQSCKEFETDVIKPSIALGLATKETVDQDMDEILKEAENRMYRNKLAESKSARSSIITSLEQTLWEKSYETEAHARRLQQLALYLGDVVNLTGGQVDDLILLASLHDIGKIAIPESIIKKAGKLSDEEWEIVKRHPEIGYRIAQSSPELGPIADAILAHHERWDGKGYPQGLKGEEIPLISRIISIVDAYDVMVHGRPYKKSLTPKEALEEIKKCAGSQFDPNLVEFFVQVISKAKAV